MKPFLKFLSFICIACLFSACQKEFSNPGNNTVSDTDATLFLSASGITNTVQKQAVTNFVIQLKEDSLWDKFLAIYPMVGGTAQTTKFNLKDPRDLDAAYRITWNGTPDFETGGVTCTKETDWGDTHLADSVLSYSNSAISYYSGTNNQTSGYDMGCSNDIFPYNILSIYEDYSNDVGNTWFNQYDADQKLPSTTKGLFMNSAKNGQVIFYTNGVVVSTFGPPVNTYTNTIITIGQVLDDPYMGMKECQLATIGQGLTSSDAAHFYTIALAFQTALGR